ncbi:response regulator [Limnobacter sp.]|uniref:response regulator n=1 Tax=Limnobacter sp. TaxID=2003368 RepID=UPI0035116711
MKIFYLEDDEHLSWLTATVLRKAGHEVVCFACADALISSLSASAANEQQPDCFLLDRDLPKRSGLEVVKWLRATPIHAQTPVVMLTACGKNDEIAEGLKAGVDVYLTKPMSRQVLLAALDHLCREYLARKDLEKQMGGMAAGMRQADFMQFRLSSLEHASNLAALLAHATDQPDRSALGFYEMLVNAIEHGNLEISYEEKSRFLEAGCLSEEIQKRFAMECYSKRQVKVNLQRQAEGVLVIIEDEGPGFDWQRYLDFDPDRAFDLHGRGIAMANQMFFDRVRYHGRGNVVELFCKCEEPA